MIKNITITNHLGESITLELRSPERSGFFIRNPGIDGLGPAKATINAEELAGMDGSIFNSSRVNARNIVFSLGFMESPTIEYIRQKSYKYFPIKQRIKIKIETDTRICEVYGYVESNEPDIFSPSEGTTISVICPDSYLFSIDKNVTVFSNVNSLFEFPFSNESLSESLLIFAEIELKPEKTVIYSGDAEIGIVIYVHALGPATNLSIIGSRTRETISINSARLIILTGSDIIEGDDIIISTIKGDKFITLQRAGVSTNILNALDKDYNWFQLQKGDNIFACTADSGITNLQFRIENQIAYEGI